MAIMDLKVNRDMLDIKFEGYKLSLDPIPVLKQPVVDGVRCCELSSEDYSYLHTRMALLHNYLFQDPWSQNSVFYINERLRVMWTSLGEDGRLNSPRCIWNVPIDATGSHSNITISFPGAEWAVLCNGRKNLHILYTPSRSAGEPWMCCHTYDMEISTSSYLLHSVHRTIPGSQQIDCIVATVEHKSKLPDDVSFPDCYTFVSVLEWISFTCGQNNQIWTTKRTRKLVSSTFPEYAAIDSIGDAVCVVSQNNFKCYFDSEGMVNSNIDTIEKEPKPPKYTYVQTPEDITVYFRVPENLKKSDFQIIFHAQYMEILVQGKCVISGDLANYIDHGACTWILDGNKLEVILYKVEIGLMWQELIKENKEGEELMDPTFIAEVHARLAHLTSETEVTPSNRVPFNLEQLEECDSSVEQLTFQRIDGNEHCETHKVNMGGHQWLFTDQICPESLPAICLRHDVDGILWQPKNIFSEGEMEHFKMEHTATFSALGYVLASKQDKKFTSCSPDFQFSVVSDCARHLYLYCQPESINSALELRNRKTGQSVAHIAKQYVVSLEHCDRILGLRVSPQCVFVLSKDTLYGVKVKS
ncbi:UNVERIFIED_CONTAM: NudC domain-containing protein 1 [Trichonephila clavipes]